MEKFKAVLEVSKKEVLFINELLAKENFNPEDLNIAEDVAGTTYTGKFSNGYFADIKICYGEANYFIDAVLFDNNACKVTDLGSAEFDRVEGVYHFEVGATVYSFEIVQEGEVTSQMVMLFRSTELSNKIMSSTVAHLRNNAHVFQFLDFEFLNLDKKSYEKFFKGLVGAPKRVYVWYDEENIIEYISSHYPSTEIRKMDYKSNLVEKYYKPVLQKETWSIAEEIINEYKSQFGMVTYYEVNEDQVFERTILKYDLDHMKKKVSYTREEAINKAVREIEGDIDNYQSSIKMFRERIEKKVDLIERLKGAYPKEAV